MAHPYADHEPVVAHAVPVEYGTVFLGETPDDPEPVLAIAVPEPVVCHPVVMECAVEAVPVPRFAEVDRCDKVSLDEASREARLVSSQPGRLAYLYRSTHHNPQRTLWWHTYRVTNAQVPERQTSPAGALTVNVLMASFNDGKRV